MEDEYFIRSVEYAIEQIDKALNRTRTIEHKLCEPGDPVRLTYQEEWNIREMIRDTRAQLNMLSDSTKTYKRRPKKTGFMRRFWGMY